MRFLLDTNALSELGKPQPDAGFMAWQDGDGEDAEREEAVFLSVLLIGEMDKGSLNLPVGAKRTLLTRQRDRSLAEYGGRILPVDLKVARRWGEPAQTHRSLGLRIDAIDELIAATALAHDLIVVTRNVRHFEHSGGKLLSPWSG